VEAIRAVFAIPFVDDIEDYIWEAIFAYAKGIPLLDPLTGIRSKRLFDIVDHQNQIGWSLKAAQRAIFLPCEFEVVIQRADIFKKAHLLGYPNGLTLSSSPTDLGTALLRHWYGKVNEDAVFQNVTDRRVSILLKSLSRKDFVYFEEPVLEYSPDALVWNWTDRTMTGLQARRKVDGALVFRWYPNQKQLFERFTFPEGVFRFQLVPERLATSDVVALLLAKLEGKL
jgi:hypothetical protein